MRPKSGLPKRKAVRSQPVFKFGFRDNPATAAYRHPGLTSDSSKSHFSVLSMFCGCGGLDLGLMGGFHFLGKTYKALPLRVIDAIDNDEKAIAAYRLNLGDHGRTGDLTTIDAANLEAADVLAGGFPCQDFSSSGPKVGLSGKRGKLYLAMVEYMQAHRPAVVVGENVPHLQRLDGGRHIRKILQDLEAVGYRFEVWELFAPEYGLPQSRRRLILVGVRNDLPGFPRRPKRTHVGNFVPIDHALADLEGTLDESVTNQSQYFVASRATAGGGQGDHTNRRGEVAYCIRANAKARIQFHYSLERRLTVRECARLQSFPDEFVFPFAAMTNMSLIGNAVPPLLGWVVGTQIAEYLNRLKTTAGQAELAAEADEILQGTLFATRS